MITKSLGSAACASGLAVALVLGGCGSEDQSSGLIGMPETAMPAEQVQVFINELASQAPDWVELYNAGEEEVVLAGYALTDDPDDPFKARLPAGTKLDPGAYAHFPLSNNDDAPSGSLPVGLSATDGDEVHLFTPDGFLVDSVSFGPAPDAPSSYARFPDGGDAWQWCAAATPGEGNGEACSDAG